MHRPSLFEAVHGISSVGQAKELVRTEVQALVQQAVLDGRVSTQQELDELFGALEMSVKALKMVPLRAWSGTKTGAKKK